MGADLYIQSDFKPNKKKYEGLFEKWVTVRNSFPEGSKQREEAQKKVSEYYEAIYSKGYFRDSYNDTSLFWLLDLSWWVDGKDMIDSNGDLTPKNAQKLLKIVKGKKELFETNLTKKDFSKWDEPKAEIEKYFREKYQSFIKFLERAIELNEPIECSV